MVKFTYPDAKYFRGIIEVLAKTMDEACFKVTPEGLKLRALDPAHVSLVDLEIPSSAFVEYECEEEYRLGFNTTMLLKLLKRGKRGDMLDISVEEEYMVIEIRGPITRRYKIRLLDVPEVELPQMELPFNVSAIVISDPLKNAIKDAEAVGDTLELEAKDETALVIRGKGEAGETETIISQDSGALISLKVSEPSRALYALDYVKNVLALTKIAESVTVEFSTAMPLKLEFSLPSEGRVIYLLAPKEE